MRRELTDYTNAVHAAYGTLNQSPYAAYGELGAVLNAPKVVLQNNVFEYTQEQIDDALREAKDLSVAAEHVGSPAKHPWRDTTKTFYSESDFDEIAQTTKVLREKLTQIITQAQTVEKSLGLPAIKNFNYVETAVAVASVIARSPGAPMQILESDAWNTPPSEARNLIERGRKTVELKERVAQKFTPSVLDQNPTDDIAYVERKAGGFLAFLAFLDSRYRAIKNRWISYRLPSYDASLIEQANDMKTVAEYLTERQALESQSGSGAALFGGLWQGEASNWVALENYIVWVLEFRRLCVQHGLKEQAISTASHSRRTLPPCGSSKEKRAK